ncbi:MAG: copper chaperone [Chloroflexi bacterium]|jgi:copper chaperone|nr:MAG: copper chaperone [Chloroflexota bacterium]RLT46734.1 MAG: copper chaperone [Chloroflexota bacterium]
MNTNQMSIPAISCGHCKLTVEREVSELAGITKATVDVELKQLTVEFETPATLVQIQGLLQEIGYPAAA